VLQTYRLAGAPGVRVQVANLGLACCAMEVESAVRLGLLLPESTDPAERTVLVVSGTVTEPLIQVVQSALSTVAGPVSVLAFGACASTGGPYWDSPTVLNGVDRIVPVQVYVAGCPPRPEALTAALREDPAARVPA
jgi:NADH-quinone oxidoreductase subunit B